MMPRKLLAFVATRVCCLIKNLEKSTAFLHIALNDFLK